MSHIRPIFLIAGNTITGVLRGVVLNVLLVLAAVMILGAMSISGLDPAQTRHMLTDSGLAVITVLGAVIAVLTGFTMIPGEIEHRTLYPVLSKPVRRWQFVLGKYLGAAGVNGITVAMLSILFFVIYVLKAPNHVFDGRLIPAVFMIYAMLLVLSALIIFFSTFMSWIGTIIASMVIWFIGSYSQFLHDLASGEDGGVTMATRMATVIQKLLPNFQAMDLRYDIVQLDTLVFKAERILLPLGGAACYLIVALILAIIIFNYREL